MNYDLDIIFQSNLFQEQLNGMPIFKDLIKDYENIKPFLNKKIAIAHVLVPNILPLIYSILIGGARAIITNCCPPTLDMETVNLLLQAGCDVDLDMKFAAEYQFGIDCGAFFAASPPKFGVVEVTRSGYHKWLETPIEISIINADDSKAKLLETFFGTPHAVFQAFKKFIDHDPASYLKEKTLAVLGFGKIGRGLARLFKEYCRVLIF